MNNDGLTLNQLAERNAVLVSEVEKLRAERDRLAAENVGLKAFGDTLFDMYKGLEISGGGIHDEQSVVCQQAALDAAMSAFEEIETPATNAAIAGIKAAIEYPKNSTPSNGWTIDPEFLSRVVERAGAVYGYHPGLEEAESALLVGLYLLREGPTNDPLPRRANHARYLCVESVEGAPCVH
jgi:hypothetical protein